MKPTLKDKLAYRYWMARWYVKTLPRAIMYYLDLNSIRKGDLYHACSGHPCRATYVSVFNDDISGYSLIDHTEGHSCSIMHCAPDKLTIDQAAKIMRDLLPIY